MVPAKTNLVLWHTYIRMFIFACGVCFPESSIDGPKHTLRLNLRKAPSALPRRCPRTRSLPSAFFRFLAHVFCLFVCFLSLPDTNRVATCTHHLALCAVLCAAPTAACLSLCLCCVGRTCRRERESGSHSPSSGSRFLFRASRRAASSERCVSRVSRIRTVA